MLDSTFKLFYHSVSFLGIYFSVKFLYEYFTKPPRSDVDSKQWFHKVVFFPDQGICNYWTKTPASSTDTSSVDVDDPFKSVCLSEKISSNISKSTSLVYLLKFIKNAEKSLDLCLLIFTLGELRDSIVEAKRRGVSIRIIVDKTMSDCDGSVLPSLQRENIPVLRGPPGVMIHHKFAVADSAKIGAMVLTGSLNWTWGAVTSNYENIIITNNPDVVIPFRNEFEKLWLKFSHATV